MTAKSHDDGTNYRLPDRRFDPQIISSWLPDETLFSVCCRHHVIAGNIRRSDTCLQLFGHARIGSSHDLPSRLGEFSTRTNNIFGDAQSVALRHTILPFYLSMRSVSQKRNALASMIGDSSGSLKAKLGILAGRFGASHPLKACQSCIRNDVQVHGVAYWHVSHQLPGTWICLKHHQLLLSSRLKVSGVDRFGWFLPETAELFPCTETFLTPNTDEVLTKLAASAAALWELPLDFEIDMFKLSRCYKKQLKQIGLSSHTGRLFADSVGRAISRVTKEINLIPEFSCLSDSYSLAFEQFSRICYGNTFVSHPLRHLIFIVAVFGSWEELWSIYQSLDEPEEELRISRPLVGINIEHVKRADVLLDLRSGELSLRGVAARHSLAVGTVMAWAASAGISFQRRPKILTTDVRKRLIRLLKQGIDKSEAARRLGVSIQTVTRTLLTETGLAVAWRTTRWRRSQASARSTWVRTAASLQLPSIKLMRSLQPAAYIWLYRNDRAWLEGFSENLPPAIRQTHSHINWDERDIRLAQEIREMSLKWYATGERSRLTLGKVCQLIPELKKRLSKLDQLPLCRAALHNISNRTKETTELL